MRLFYSWQSDVPANTKLIRKALQAACASLQIAYTEDTRGEAGADHVVDVLLRKIAGADVVVGDVTIVGHTAAGKPLINSNVAYELGYAEAVLGRSQLLMVFNTAFGSYEDLPFDLSKRMVTAFEAPNGELDEAAFAAFIAHFKQKLKRLMSASSPASKLGLNTYERTILYWVNQRGKLLRVVNSFTKFRLLMPGQSAKDSFYDRTDRRGRALFDSALRSLCAKGLLAPIYNESSWEASVTPVRWTLTEEGEHIAQRISSAEVQELHRIPGFLSFELWR